MFNKRLFEVGDRVICLHNIENFHGYEFKTELKVGTVRVYEKGEYGIEFDEDINGHTLKNNKTDKDICENGHGLWCRECNLIKLNHKTEILLNECIKNKINMEKEIVNMENLELLFAKVREGAVIPTKRDEDAGRDLYACFDEDFMIIKSLETKMIPTGIATAFSSQYYAQIQERGSTGTKGMKYGAGVIDSGYRNEWFVPITNCNDKDLIIVKKDAKLNFDKGYEYIAYPYEKAIAQFVMIEVPKFIESEVSLEELQSIKSERGMGALGSSGK